MKLYFLVLTFARNCKNKQLHEIQSTYFGHEAFHRFTQVLVIIYNWWSDWSQCHSYGNCIKPKQTTHARNISSHHNLKKKISLHKHRYHIPLINYISGAMAVQASFIQSMFSAFYHSIHQSLLGFIGIMKKHTILRENMMELVPLSNDVQYQDTMAS